MKKIRVGIIGTGAISHRHMSVYRHIPGMEVVAAAEIDERKLTDWGAKYGIQDTYTDFREMLKRDDIDSVDVCVHNNLHAPIAIAVMKAGKACYSEKPMSATYADSKLMYDCAKATGVKFAIQISSLFSAQTRIGKKVVDSGALGDIYHAKSFASSYRRRPSVDTMGTPDFMSKYMAGHGQAIDLGSYYLGQMLYLLGLPGLKTVFGKAYYKMPNPVAGRKIEVEDMGIALAEFTSGVTLDILQANATNAEDNGGYITGNAGALKLQMIDAFGGEWAMQGFGGGMPGMMPEAMQPKLSFVGEYKGIHVDCDLKAYYNQMLDKTYDPGQMMWYDNQMHWYSYLSGILNDETRYNTPLIGLQTSLLCDGLFLSGEQGRALTADEIKTLSKSTAIWKQETPWGVFDYDSTL